MIHTLFYFLLLVFCGLAAMWGSRWLFSMFSGDDTGSRIAELRYKLFEDNPLTKDLRGRIEESQKLMLARTGDIMDLRKATTDKERSQIALERRLAQSTTSLAVYDGELGEVKGTLREHDDLASEMSRKLAAAEATSSVTATELDKLRRAVGDNDLKIVDLERLLGAAEKSTSARAAERIAGDADLKKVKRDAESADGDLAKFRREATDVKELLERHRAEVDKLRDEESALSRAVASRQQEHDRRQSLLDSMRFETTQSRQRASEIDDKIATADAARRDAERRGDACRDEIQRLRPEVEASAKARKQLQSYEERRRVFDSRLPELRRRSERLDQERQRLRVALEATGTALAKLRPDQASLREKTDGLDRELSRLLDEASAKDSELADLARTVEDVEGALARGDAFGPLRTEIGALRREVETLESRETDRNNRIGSLKLSLNELKAALDQAERENVGLQGQRKALEGEFTEMTATHQHASLEVRTAMTDLEGIELRLRSKESQSRHLNELLRGIDTQLAALSADEMQTRRALRECQNDMQLVQDRIVWLDTRLKDGTSRRSSVTTVTTVSASGQATGSPTQGT